MSLCNCEGSMKEMETLAEVELVLRDKVSNLDRMLKSRPVIICV